MGRAYNALLRGLAQGYAVPFLDVHQAIDPLTDRGLSGDGIHLNRYRDGAAS